MRYRCPICSFEFIGGGLCPHPYHVTTMMEELPEQEENSEVKSIEYKGNVHRFHGQKSGKLIDVEERLAREISCVVSENIGKEIPKNSVTRFIVLTFIGEKGVPFQDLIRYGAARKTSLVKDIGKWFDIDSPTTEEQVEIELKAQEVKE